MSHESASSEDTDDGYTAFWTPSSGLRIGGEYMCPTDAEIVCVGCTYTNV